MKRQMLLSLTLSLLAANALAIPAAEQNISAEAKPSTEISQPLGSLAEGGSDRTLQRDRFAEGGSDRLLQRDRIAEGGSDRLREQNQRMS
ncbi:hypothetical protein D3C76_319650 [compost metagenome]